VAARRDKIEASMGKTASTTSSSVLRETLNR